MAKEYNLEQGHLTAHWEHEVDQMQMELAEERQIPNVITTGINRHGEFVTLGQNENETFVHSRHGRKRGRHFSH